MGRKIQKPNPPGSNQSATRNAERAWKKEPIDPKTFSTLVSGTLRVPTTMRDQPLATRTSSELGSEPEIAAAWGTISFDHPGLRPARMFTFPEFPGLVVMKDALQPSLQRDLITACLREYTQPPNVTNLDTHYHIPPEGIWERFLKDPGSVLPVREFESGEIAQENATDTHLAGSKGHISNIKIDPPTSQRPYVKPVTVEDALMKLRWTSIGFQYYWKTKTYHLDRRVAMPELIESVTRAIIKAVEPETGYSVNKWRPEAGIVNFYHYKDSLTAHQDRSEINTEAPLVSLSLGNSGIFLMGTLDREDEPAPILLESGDIVILSGTSRRAFHGVPRILERTCPDYLTQSESSPAFKPYAEFIQSARININIRQVFE